MQDYRELCRKAYQETVQKIPIPMDLRVALKTHERVPAFIDRLASEFAKVQDLRIRQGKTPVSPRTLSSTVADMTQLFISGVVADAAKRAQSDIAKHDAERRAKDRAEIELAMQGKMTGDFAEAGLEVTEIRQES